jgi:hypothetical protein
LLAACDAPTVKEYGDFRPGSLDLIIEGEQPWHAKSSPYYCWQAQPCRCPHKTRTNPVTWVNGKNVTISGDTLTEACRGCGDAGAESRETLASGDGYFDFTVGSKDIFAVGIGGGAPSTNVDSIEFALRFNGSGIAEVRENGRYITDTRYSEGAWVPQSVELYQRKFRPARGPHVYQREQRDGYGQ